VFGDPSTSWQDPKVPEYLLTKLCLGFERLRTQPLSNGLTIREWLNTRVVTADLPVDRRVQRHHVLRIVNSLCSEAPDVPRSLLNNVMPVLARPRRTQRSL
jgi:hypothetical protein